MSIEPIYKIGILALFVLLFSVSGYAELDLGPYTPSAIPSSPFVEGFSTTLITYDTALRVPLALHEGPATIRYGMNPTKGTFGENLMHEFFARTGPWTQGSPARIGNTGIDGLYFETDRTGRISDVMVAEAKYGSSQLGTTKLDGPQMGKQWIARRMALTANNYSDIAERIHQSGAVRAEGSARPTKGVIRVPLKNGGYADVWYDKGIVRFFSPNQSTSAKEVMRQAQRVTQYCQAVVDGKIDAKTRLFKYSSEGNQHKITIQSVGPDGVPVGKLTTIKAPYEELPPKIQMALERNFRKVFLAMGKSKEEAKVLANECCQNPEYFKQMTADMNWSWKTGINRGLLISSAWVGMGLAVADIATGLLGEGSINPMRIMATGGLGLTSTVLGAYSGVQTSAFLCSTNVGRNLAGALPNLPGISSAAFVSSIAAGTVASAVFSYGMFAFGLTDLRTANEQMLLGIAGTAAAGLFNASVFAAAATFGTAGSGAAIGSLSGVAFTNASLAWLGGGTVAAGGGGVALGSVVLTGGTIVVVLAVPAVYSYVKYLRDSSAQNNLLAGKTQIVVDRVIAGKQPEWAS